MRAWQGAGSDHVVFQQREVTSRRTSSTTILSRGVGDVDWQQNPPLFQMTGPDYVTKKTAKGTSTKADSEKQVYTENVLAVKINLGPWSCNRFFGYSALPGSPSWDETSPWGIEGKNLGISKVNGVPAWHLRSVLAYSGPKGSKSLAVKDERDYYASTSTYLPVRIQRYYKDSSKGVTNTTRITLNLSKFGEPVHVALPAACSKLNGSTHQ
jgi:hypothetical protein